MSPWVMAIGALLNFLGGQGAAAQEAEANKLAAKQVRTQNQLVKYLLEKRKRLYDPIEEQQLIPRLTERMENAPFYAGDWLAHSRELRQPMTLS